MDMTDGSGWATDQNRFETAQMICQQFKGEYDDEEGTSSIPNVQIVKANQREILKPRSTDSALNHTIIDRKEGIVQTYYLPEKQEVHPEKQLGYVHSLDPLQCTRSIIFSPFPDFQLVFRTYYKRATSPESAGMHFGACAPHLLGFAPYTSAFSGLRR
ncbi:hypothetical protein BDZ45DRAFT_803856 [Acephala macrosclerotiorum]|nr:hypothetical protein BDZ45DRAFT_803856 [Acephala macrosclerotiorum]